MASGWYPVGFVSTNITLVDANSSIATLPSPPSATFFLYSTRMTRFQANALLLLAGAIWGMGFVAQAKAMEDVGPFLFIGMRFLVASLVILPFAIVEAHRSPYPDQLAASVKTWLNLPGKHLARFSLIGVSLFMGMAFQQVGLLSTSVTNSGFLTGLYVVFTPFLAVFVFRDKPASVVWVAALMSMCGIYLLSGGDLRELVRGDVLTVFSAMFWALQVVLIAKFVGQSGRPLALSLVQFMVTAGLALLVAVLIEPFAWSSVLAAAPEILYTGVFASGVAFTLQVIGQRYTTAPQAAIFLSSEAPFAAIFAYLWLGERIAGVGLLGCALILLAMLVVEIVPQWRESISRAKSS